MSTRAPLGLSISPAFQYAKYAVKKLTGKAAPSGALHAMGTGQSRAVRADTHSAKAPHRVYPITRSPLRARVPQNSRPPTRGGFGVPGYPPVAVIVSAKL